MGYFIAAENISTSLNSWCAMHDFIKSGTASNKIWAKSYILNGLDVSLVIHIDEEYIEIDLRKCNRHKDIRFKELDNYASWNKPFTLQRFLEEVDKEIDLMIL